MNKFVEYIKNSFDELKNKVTWPTFSQLQNFTSIVIFSLFLITIVILVMDKISEFGILELIYGSLLS
jgi:preprotein translocase subunit SecE